MDQNQNSLNCEKENIQLKKNMSWKLESIKKK